MLKNKKGFTLPEMLLSLTIVGIIISCVVSYFNVYTQTIFTRQNIISSTNDDMIKQDIQGVIRESHLSKNNKPLPNSEMKKDKFTTYTSYYTKDANQLENYSFICDTNTDGNLALFGQRGSQDRIPLVTKLSKCSFGYYNVNKDKEISNIEDLNYVKIYLISQNNKGVEKDIVYKQKLMQEN